MQFHIVTQPFDADGTYQTLGEALLSLLSSQSTFYNRIYIVSAFANQKAVLRLAPYLLSLKERGAQIRIVVGIDHRATSLEALQNILGLNVDARVVNNPVPGHTFHPKIYLLEASSESAELFIGSNNLTEGGLYTNYEAFVHFEFDLTQDGPIYQEVLSSLDRLLNPNALIVQSLTEDLLHTLYARGDIVSEASRRFIDRETEQSRRRAPVDESSETSLPETPFRVERIPFAPSFDIAHLPRYYFEHSNRVTPRGEMGALLWRKENLPPSDVQRQTGNVTGGLRLTQARWEVNGTRIDHTRYFRYEVFGNLNWSIGVYPPRRRETTLVPFEVVILGTNYGIHHLVVSHKPSGEAGQRNYTTMLHWGELGTLIQELNLVGKKFYLYAPPDGEDGPYRIEITD